MPLSSSHQNPGPPGRLWVVGLSVVALLMACAGGSDDHHPPDLTSPRNLDAEVIGGADRDAEDDQPDVFLENRRDAGPGPADAESAPDAGEGADAFTSGGDPDAAPLPDAEPMEPDAEPLPPVGPGELLISEVDYDQEGADIAEFIEVLNPGDEAVILTGLTLEGVNGNNNQVYLRVSLDEAGTLPGGARLVAGSEEIIAAIGDPEVPVLALPGALQNGAPDAVRLVNQEGALIDAVAYEGEVPEAGEGRSPEARDEGAGVSNALARCPDGHDADDNAEDFVLAPPTPGATNACP